MPGPDTSLSAALDTRAPCPVHLKEPTLCSATSQQRLHTGLFVETKQITDQEIKRKSTMEEE